MQKKIKVGSEVESYCGRCKMVLNHIVAAMVEDEPRRVRCLTCQSEHNHRLPSTRTKQKRSSTSRGAKTTRTTKSTATSKWNKLITEWDGANAKSYSIYDSFSENDWVNHVTFGKGLVTEVRGPTKIITLFESGVKMLMHGKQKP